MAADHHAARQALERRRSRVVGVERLDGARAGHPRDVAEQDQHQRDHRQDQVLQLGEETRARRARWPRPAASRARPRTRRSGRSPTRTRARSAPTGPTTLIVRSIGLPTFSADDDAAEDPERHDDHEREQRPASASGRARSSGSARSAPGTGSTSPGEVLIQFQYWVSSGLSTPSWWSSAWTALGAASGPRIERAGIAGQDLAEHEHDHAQDPQRDQRQPEPLEDEPASCPPRPLMRRLVRLC